MKTIQEIFKEVKPEWKYAVYQKNLYHSKKDNKWNTKYEWILFRTKPHLIDEVTNIFEWFSPNGSINVSCLFDIEPFDGDWKNSLTERTEQ